MKNKIAIISGFILGMAGFLLLFKLIFLVRIPPSDEIAPGIVVIASILSGVFFAFTASRIHHYFVKKRKYKI